MLDNLIGQETLKKFLAHEIRNNTLSHGYIIEGPKYMGKSFIATNIAIEITSPTYIDIILPTENRKLRQESIELNSYAYMVAFILYKYGKALV